MNLQLEYTPDELLMSDPVVEPLFANGKRCHGGFDGEGRYVSPRVANRRNAISAWQLNHISEFATELIPTDVWRPEPFYPSVDGAWFLWDAGIREPVIEILTLIGTVEGLGAAIRFEQITDLQPFFVESIEGTTLAHLPALFEAHARDEAGFDGEGGHMDMWYCARDLAFESPVVNPDQVQQMAIEVAQGQMAAASAALEKFGRDYLETARERPQIDPALEAMITRMCRLMLIEINAASGFVWAREVLANERLSAAPDAAPAMISYVQQDETTHVDYLRTALTEMRDRTFLATDGSRLDGQEVIGAILDSTIATHRMTLRNGDQRSAFEERVQIALEGRRIVGRRARDLLAEFRDLAAPASEPAPSTSAARSA